MDSPKVIPESGVLPGGSTVAEASACEAIKEGASEEAPNDETVDAGKAAEGSDSDGDDSEDESQASAVQLGFADELDDDDELMFSDPDWSTWDGGRVGGLPFWLDPRALPPAKDLECSTCKDPLAFLLQIYCPLDQVASAFHRMLFLFCCRRGSCPG
jgi:pre-rRNA-processing protein TSR4